jgi:hypothetical protein
MPQYCKSQFVFFTRILSVIQARRLDVLERPYGGRGNGDYGVFTILILNMVQGHQVSFLLAPAQFVTVVTFKEENLQLSTRNICG